MDYYRERWLYETVWPRPEGMHSGDTEFKPCGRAGCAECSDPSTCERCSFGTVPKNAADRVFYDNERDRLGRSEKEPVSVRERMMRQQVASAAIWRQTGLQPPPPSPAG